MQWFVMGNIFPYWRDIHRVVRSPSADSNKGMRNQTIPVVRLSNVRMTFAHAREFARGDPKKVILFLSKNKITLLHLRRAKIPVRVLLELGFSPVVLVNTARYPLRQVVEAVGLQKVCRTRIFPIPRLLAAGFSKQQLAREGGLKEKDFHTAFKKSKRK
jgi:hypothetical protein